MLIRTTLLLTLAACATDNDLNGVPNTPTVYPLEFEVLPPSIDYGAPRLEKPATASVSLFNTGQDDLLIHAVLAPPGMEATVDGQPVIHPGGAVPISVTWTPEDTRAIDQEMHLVISNGGEQRDVLVPILGSAAGGFLTVSTNHYDFGTIGIGCERDLAITLANTGNEELVVDAIRATGSAAFGLKTPTLPLTLAPFQSEQVDVHFQPMDIGPASSILEIDTGGAPTYATLKGGGVAEGQNELTWTVGEEGGKMIVVFHIHGWFIPGGWSETYGHGMWASYFESSIEHYFEVLQDNGADYRMAFLWHQDGKVRGNVPYLDNSYSPAESKRIVFEEMLEDAVNTDIDMSWPIYVHGMEENQDWMAETSDWEKSKLSFILVHRDQEQSGWSWLSSMETLQSYRDDEELVTINAISGPPPVGCEGIIEYPRNYYEAINATEGLILSACEPDWTDHWEEMAAHTMNGSAFFSLEGTVLESSIEVYVDGQRQTQGWSYDAGFNAVMFDEGYFPGKGRTVEVRYIVGGSCDD